MALAGLLSAPTALASAGVLTTGISSAPAVIDDPHTVSREVFYDNHNELTVDAAFDPFGVWNGPKGLAAGISGAPAAIVDPYTGNTEVYYDNHGELTEVAFLTHGQTWTGPIRLAAGITGSPSVVVFHSAGQLQIFYDHGGQLYHDVLVAGRGFGGPQAVGSPISGSPVAIDDPYTGNQEIYYNNNGELTEDAWVTSTRTWTNAMGLAPGITGTPAVANYPQAGQLQLYYNHANQLYGDVFTAGRGWSGPGAVGSPILGSPTALATPSAFGGPTPTCMSIYYEGIDFSRRNVTDLSDDSWCPGSRWSNGVDLTTGLTGAVVPVLSNQSVINTTYTGCYCGNSQQVYFQSGNKLAWQNGTFPPL